MTIGARTRPPFEAALEAMRAVVGELDRYNGESAGPRTRALLDFLHEAYGVDVAGRDVVDLGAGNGAPLLWMVLEAGAARGTAVDVDRRRLATLRATLERLGVTDIEVHEADANSFARPGLEADLVIAVDIFSSDRVDPAAVVRTARRLLRPGGHLVFKGANSIYRTQKITRGPASQLLPHDAAACAEAYFAQRDRVTHRMYAPAALGRALHSEGFERIVTAGASGAQWSGSGAPRRAVPALPNWYVGAVMPDSDDAPVVAAPARARFDDALAAMQEVAPTHGGYNRELVPRRTEQLVDFLTESQGVTLEGRSVADLGAGNGGPLLWMLLEGGATRGIAIEMHPARARIIRAIAERLELGTERLEVQQVDFTKVDPEPGSVDVATIMDLATSRDLDVTRLVEVAATMVRPGGHVVVKAPNIMYPYKGVVRAEPSQLLPLEVADVAERYIEERTPRNHMMSAPAFARLLLSRGFEAAAIAWASGAQWQQLRKPARAHPCLSHWYLTARRSEG